MSSDDNAAASTPAVIATELKLPNFWPKNPRVWFSQVEARFQLRHITSQSTKYLHVVAALPPEIAETKCRLSTTFWFHPPRKKNMTPSKRRCWTASRRLKKADCSSSCVAKSWATNDLPNCCTVCGNYSVCTRVRTASSHFFVNFSCNGSPSRCAWFSRVQMRRPLIN